MKKIFVLDTNVLLHNSAALYAFGDNTVVLPLCVLEELDTFKKESNERGRNAREIIRALDSLKNKGDLRYGVDNGKGGRIKILLLPPEEKELAIDRNLVDNQILIHAYRLTKDYPEEKVIFVSKDINARLKAQVIGVESEDYEEQCISIDSLYTGFRTFFDDNMYSELIQNNQVEVDSSKWFPNEYAVISANNEVDVPLVCKHVSKNNMLVVLPDNHLKLWGVVARSVEQRIAFDMLLDRDIKLVTLAGQAGTGKTLLAIAAALETVVTQKVFRKILISRPIMPMGKDIGYLPGSKEDKIDHWMNPIHDNIEFILSTKTPDVQTKVFTMFKEGIIEFEALTYIRGRSIPNQYVIIDEAQNLTPHEIKTIISRVGVGTKMILTGDPQQIDNPYLDATSNGLTYVAERLKDEQLHGHITLSKSERSPLAALAARKL